MKTADLLLQKYRAKTGTAYMANSPIDILPASSVSPEVAVYRYAQQASADRRRQRAQAEQELVAARWLQFNKEYRNTRDSAIDMIRRMPPPASVRGGTLMAQLSDLHFNALISRKDGDRVVKFNFAMASKRLRRYAEVIKWHQLTTGAERLVVAMTGDLVNSLIGKTAPGKLLNSEVAQQHAMQLGADLLISFVCDLQENAGFTDITICGVGGNEGRLHDQRQWEDKGAGDNCDIGIHAILKREFFSQPGFTLCYGTNKLVMEVEQQKCLLMHGDSKGMPSSLDQKSITSLLGQYRCDFGISGHVHYAVSTHNWIRSSSLCGPDPYATDGLDYEAGRANQNLILLQGKNRSVLVVDLEDPGEEPGYLLQEYAGAFGTCEMELFIK